MVDAAIPAACNAVKQRSFRNGPAVSAPGIFERAAVVDRRNAIK